MPSDSTEGTSGSATQRVRRSVAKEKESLRHLLARFHLTPVTMGVALATLIALIVVIFHVNHLPRDLRADHPSWWLLGAAMVVAYGQYVGFAVSLSGASSIPLPPLRTFELEVAESLTQMGTPEGIGSLALSLRYLNGKGLKGAEAATAVGLSAFVSTASAGVVVPIGSIFAASSINVAKLKADVPSSTWLVVLLVVAAAVVVTVLIKAPKARAKVGQWVAQAKAYGLTMVHQPARGAVIAFGEIFTIAAQTLCMILVLAALHKHADLAALVVITQLASGASNVVPVPGGLGAPEAILVAGLTATGIHQSEALVAALTFRMFTYWLPPVPGLALLFHLARRGEV